MSVFNLNNKLMLAPMTQQPTREQMLELAKVPLSLEKNCCNFCPELKSNVSDLTHTKSYSCNKFLLGKSARPRYISHVQASDNSLVKKPDWCPLMKNNTSNKENMVNKTIWGVPNHTSIEDIKVGGIYVCPAGACGKRRIVEVTGKYNTYIRCKILNTALSYNDYVNLYPSDLEMKYIVPLRKVKSPFPEDANKSSLIL